MKECIHQFETIHQVKDAHSRWIERSRQCKFCEIVYREYNEEILWLKAPSDIKLKDVIKK